MKAIDGRKRPLISRSRRHPPRHRLQYRGMKSFLPENSIFSGRELSRGERIAVSIPVAVAAAIAAWLAFQLVPEMIARDFTYPWWGARALLDGKNPYDAIRPTGPPPNDMWFMYPLTAPIAVLPFTFLPAQVAGALFSGLSAGILAFVLSAKGGLRQFVFFLSPSFGFAIVLGQWSPLLVAAALSWPLSWALVCKPTIGLPLFLYRPSWRAAIMCGAFLILSLLVQPSWPLDWWRNSQMIAPFRSRRSMGRAVTWTRHSSGSREPTRRGIRVCSS